MNLNGDDALTLAEILQFLEESAIPRSPRSPRRFVASSPSMQETRTRRLYLITRDVASEAGACADLNRDGVVNFGDLALMKGAFFQSCTP